jgi:mannose/fructose/N-acetylgalactosamine-specific phosphotransferase system component IIC
MIDLGLAMRVSLVGGLISLDGTALMQLMISEPLPACALLGLFTGQPAAGLVVGIAFQLLFVSDLPVGSHLPKDAAILSMSALGAALVAAGGRATALSIDLLAASALLAVAAEPLFAWTGRLVRHANQFLTPAVRRRIAAGHFGRALLLAQGGLAVFWLRGFVSLLVFSLAGGALLAQAAARLPAGLFAAARWSFAVFPLVGAAHFLGSMRARDLRQVRHFLPPRLSRRTP